MPGFRFDAEAHTYTDLATGEVLPHITEMLEAAELIDSLWMTPESAERGSAVHKMTAAYDHGALDPAECRSPFAGWLQAHAQAMQVLRPRILEVEIPSVNWRYRFGGRPDRLWQLDGLTLVEVKSGAPEKAHPIQTALQAILKGPELRLRPEQIRRAALYLQSSGKWELRPHRELADFDAAYKVLREYPK